MSTRTRHEEKETFYFVTLTYHQGLLLIAKSGIFDYLPAWTTELNRRGPLACGYVCMPNHIHLLLFITKCSWGLNHVVGESKRF